MNIANNDIIPVVVTIVVAIVAVILIVNVAQRLISIVISLIVISLIGVVAYGAYQKQIKTPKQATNYVTKDIPKVINDGINMVTKQFKLPSLNDSFKNK